MAKQVYQVIRSVDELDTASKESLTKQCRMVLSSFQVGQTIESRKFINTEMPKYCASKQHQNIACVGYRFLREGKRVGVLEDKSKDQRPISFDEFLQQESIQYWI